jgi:hypothetical protein
VLMVHRARTLVVANRNAQVNQIGGLLGKFAVVVPTGVARPPRELPGPAKMRKMACGSLLVLYLPDGSSNFMNSTPARTTDRSVYSPRRVHRRPSRPWWRAWATLMSSAVAQTPAQ